MDAGGELGQHLGTDAARRTGAEQPGEHRVVGGGAPGQAVPGHLGGGQGAGGLGGGQQAQPVGVLGQGDPALLVGVHGDHRFQRVGARRQMMAVGGEEHRLVVGAAFARVVRHGESAQPGPAGAQRTGQAPALLGTEQQGLDELEVVAPGRTGREPLQQRRVDLVGGGPHPARRLPGLALGDGRHEVADGLRGTVRGAVLVQRLQPPAGPQGVGDDGDGQTPGRGHRSRVERGTDNAPRAGQGRLSRLTFRAHSTSGAWSGSRA